MDSTTRDFVSIVVNVHVDSWQTSNGTRKSVVICNSTICTTYQYQANGTFISVLEEDNNDQYEYDDEGSTTGSNAGHGGGEGGNPYAGGPGGGSPPNGGGGCTGNCGGGTVIVHPIGGGGGGCVGQNPDNCSESVAGAPKSPGDVAL